MDQESLIKKTRYLEHIIALMPGHVYWKDKNGVYLGCNDLQAHSLGYSSGKEIVGKTDHDLPWKDQAEKLQEIDHQVMTGIDYTVEEPVVLADGSAAVFLSKKVPLYDDETGEIIGILGISFNITDRKKAEEDLRQAKIKEELQEETIGILRIIADSIAHELRTPLRTINSSASGLRKYLPALIQTYKIAAQAQLNIPEISPTHYKLLETALQNILLETQSAFTFIDMSLVKANESAVGVSHHDNCSMVRCINEMLSRYTLTEQEKALIHFKKDKDFNFKGNETLMIHVLFNLLKNALYYVKAAGKGEIYINLLPGEEYHELHFKDTGSGISPENLPKIFDRFYSTTKFGTGIGLSFCKTVMKNFGGDIICRSRLNDYTEFVLTFPVVPDSFV